MSLFRLLSVVLWGMSIAAAVSHAADDAPPKIALKKIVEGLDMPVDLQSDGTDRLFIVEQRGRIRLLVDGKLDAKPYFLDISKQVDFGGEKGLLGLAFHPDFAKNGLFYVNYTTSPNRKLKTRVSEFRVDPKASRADKSTERVILEVDQPYPNHNGGQVQFGPDRFLYIGMGDGGSGGDPQNRAQNMKDLLGKMLRIDVNKREGGKAYGVPKDNPFVGNSRYAPEIWATGLRNPWRFSFDRKTGEMYTGDVGQNLYEEIDIIEKGGNYGWRIREGTHAFNTRDKSSEKLIDPIKEYDRSYGLSVTGGYVYRGKEFPALDGWYLYGDFGSGRIFGLKTANGKLTDDVEFLGPSNVQPSSFGEDAAGEMYIVNHGGRIFKIVESKQ